MRNKIPDASFTYFRFNPHTKLNIHTQKLGLSSGPGIGDKFTIGHCHSVLMCQALCTVL